MAAQYVMRLILLLLLTYRLAEAAPPMAKHNCSSTCGNVSIPYPFGIGHDCYMDKSFEIICNGSDVSPKAFLPSIDLEVLDINITDPFNKDDDYFSEPVRIRVNMPIISSNCSMNNRSRSGGVNMSGTPFSFSSYRNIFISVGCDNMAMLTDLDPILMVGCKSDCIVSKKSMAATELVNGIKCSGFNCCQTSIPTGIQLLNVEFRSIEQDRTSEDCRHAFLAEEQWLASKKIDSSYEVQFLEHVPVVLQLAVSNFTAIDSLELRRRNAFMFIIDNGTELYYSCRHGYEGNPYLSTGCQGKLLNSYDFPIDFTLHA